MLALAAWGGRLRLGRPEHHLHVRWGRVRRRVAGGLPHAVRGGRGRQGPEDPTLSYAKIETMVDAGNVTIDVIPAEGYWAVQQCGDLLEPLDTASSTSGGVEPNRCTTSVQRRCSRTRPRSTTTPTPTHSPTGPTRCKEFFDTERYPGTRSVRSSPLPNP